MRISPPRCAPSPKVSVLKRIGDSAMKIWRSGRVCIASAKRARSNPATPPATRPAAAAGSGFRGGERKAAAAPALSAMAIRAACPSETTPTTIQRWSNTGRMPTTAI